MDSAAQSGPLVCLLLTALVGCAPLNRNAAAPVDLPITSPKEAVSGSVMPSSFEPAAPEPHPHESDAYTLDEIVVMARTTHPRAIAALRSVDQANAEIEVAGLRSNPDLVLDVDTPVNGNNNRTELSARLTFPIGPANRNARIRVARAKSMTASARYRDTLRQVEEAALDAAIDVVYLQERLSLEEESVRISRGRAELLRPESRDGEAANNLTESLNASARADRAAESLLDTQRELALARLTLVESMGIDLSQCPSLAETIWVQDTFKDVPLDLPSLPQVISSSLATSPELVARRGEVTEGWLQYRAERDRTLPWKIGPRYDDQLGDDDDTVGVRVRTQFAFHDHHQRTRARAAALDARVSKEQLNESRNAIARQVAGDLQELRLIAERLKQLRSDRFIEEQQNRLEDPIAAKGMTGEQALLIEEAIIDRKKARLDLEYRFKRLHSRLCLHAAVDEYTVGDATVIRPD